eukprot:7383180-Prymnesium_polylepis.1
MGGVVALIRVVVQRLSGLQTAFVTRADSAGARVRTGSGALNPETTRPKGTMPFESSWWLSS